MLGNSVEKIYDNAFANKPITSIYAPDVTELGSFCFRNTGITEITDSSFPQLLNVGISSFEAMKSLQKIHLSKVTNIEKAYLCKDCTALKVFRFPSATSKTVQQLVGNDSNLLVCDMGSVTQLAGNVFYGASQLNILILRNTSIVSLQNTSSLNYTAFKQGGAGGTIYIPKVLYDHLGDNSSDDYKSATNWSTYDGYGTITWAKLEGSPYEDPDWDDSGFLT